MDALKAILIGFCYGLGGTFGYKVALWIMEILGR